MKRLSCVFLLAITLVGVSTRQTLAVPVFGGQLDIADTTGAGPDASYIVIDFGGDPPRPGTPQGVYAFEFLYDDTVDTTLGDALDQLVSAGIITAQFNNDFAGTIGRFVEGFTHLNADGQTEDKILEAAEVFPLDGFFWHVADRYDATNGTWQGSDFGIDALDAGSPVDRIANPDAYLTDGSFHGFVVRNFLSGASPDPRVPTITAANGSPEPSSVLLAMIAGILLVQRRRRRAKECFV